MIVLVLFLAILNFIALWFCIYKVIDHVLAMTVLKQRRHLKVLAFSSIAIAIAYLFTIIATIPV